MKVSSSNHDSLFKLNRVLQNKNLCGRRDRAFVSSIILDKKFWKHDGPRTFCVIVSVVVIAPSSPFSTGNFQSSSTSYPFVFLFSFSCRIIAITSRTPEPPLKVLPSGTHGCRRRSVTPTIMFRSISLGITASGGHTSRENM